MASGFLALLDDISVLARAAASSLDDLASAAMKASAKAAGVAIDDAAVTPQYVKGLEPKRELSVIKQITMGSLRNKFFIILPAAMIFSTWAPWILPVFLILGGSYLAFEGAEKVLGWCGIHLHEEVTAELKAESPEALERKIVAGAVRTDLVLSAEIMLITLANVEVVGFWPRLGVLCIVAVVMTIAVYGVVAILVKMDDIGMVFAKSKAGLLASLGRGIVKGMPLVFSFLSVVGTVAMLWVGGHIVAKSLSDLGFTPFYDVSHWIIESLTSLGPVVAWFGDTIYSAILGLALGLILVAVMFGINKVRRPNAVAVPLAEDQLSKD